MGASVTPLLLPVHIVEGVWLPTVNGLLRKWGRVETAVLSLNAWETIPAASMGHEIAAPTAHAVPKGAFSLPTEFLGG